MRKRVRRSITRLAVLVGLVLVLPVLTSCSKEVVPPLRIASSPWPGYEPIYLARDLGYLSKDKVNVFELPSSDITMESFRNHSADMATLTSDETIDLLASGVKLRILYVMDVSNGADAVMASPKIKTLADLKGKRIVIENLPLGVYMLSRTLNAAHLTREEVTVIPSAESKHPEMYKQGKGDAFITFDPFKTQMAALGAHVLFDSSKIPNEIFDVMVVHEEVFQARREEVCSIAQQWFRALDFIKQSPDEAAARIRKRLGASEAEYRAMIGGIVTPSREENLRLLSGPTPAILEPAKTLVEVMLKEGQLQHEVDVRNALDKNIVGCIGK